MSARRILIVGIATVALGGCDAFDDDDEDDVGGAAFGVFVDSPVDNLHYETTSRSGETSNDGIFQYEEGGTIVFSIGDIALPAVAGSTVITPLDIFDTDNVSDRRVINLARLLQSLDADADPTNGIDIVDAAHTTATGMSLNFDVPTGDFETDTNVLALVANGPQGDLISAGDALEHLSEISLAGSWISIDDEESDMQSATLTFMSDGTYMQAEGTIPFEGEDASAGIEYGTYTWNPATGDIEVETEISTVAGWGLSNDTVDLSLVREGSSTLFTIIDGEPFDYSSVTGGPEDPLIGAWVASLPEQDAVVVLVFTDELNGFSGVARYYSWSEFGPQADGGQSGAEFGTYTWNSQTGALITVPRTDASGDTNGDWGFSGQQSGVSATLVDEDSLALEFVAGGGLTLTRVE